MYCDPRITGSDEDFLIFSFDILSFDSSDDTNSDIYLEELSVDQVSCTSYTRVVTYEFDGGTSDSWAFAGLIDPYDIPLTHSSNGHIGLSPDSSTNCFSYWSSPDITVNDDTLYVATFNLSSSVIDSDNALQFRLRINQKGSWQSWDRVINSNGNISPTILDWKDYEVFFNPAVMNTLDEKVILSFDILSFNNEDDTDSWLFLESLALNSVTVEP
jgi:hypothetical protein